MPGRADRLRYRRGARRDAHVKPVVVWNCTQACNLKCLHCYSAGADTAGDQLTTEQGRALIDDLAEFGAPVLLLSGGEPLMRPDVVELLDHARGRGLSVALSTNGTLITPELAARLAAAGVRYVGVSLDGPAETNDAFRGAAGAFDAALAGLRHCREVGLPVGLRMTINTANVAEIPAIFDLVAREQIARLCFYHFVPVGRGSRQAALALSAEQTRRAVDTIIDGATALHAAGHRSEVLTVGNHADAPYVYMRLAERDGEAAERALELLTLGGGNRSGVGIGCVSCNGDVLPDQFWRQAVLGNVHRRPFSSIWTDPAAGDGLAGRLRDRHAHLKGRCAQCRWLSLCNGNLRARAEALTGDRWAADPGCYLTDAEIV